MPDDFVVVRTTDQSVVLIDPQDYALVAPYSWRRHKGRHTNYARAEIWHKNRRSYLYMHRLITGAPSEILVDHINGDGLDNRRCNLRLADHRVNGRNRHNPYPKRGPKSNCIQGHPMTGDNLLVRSNGRRECRTCKRRRDVESKRRSRCPYLQAGDQRVPVEMLPAPQTISA